ncbi:MAG TPA: hypothetical protein DEQ02_08085 [Ruminococcaceae bacterium]|nr:hypothetical protein [Oscillospiraceae bacterium]
MQKNLVKIKEFCEKVKVDPRKARQWARSKVFLDNKISFDVSVDETKPPRKGRARRNKDWRIDLDRYYAALDEGLFQR